MSPPFFFEKKKSNTFCRFDKKYNLNFTPNVVIGGQKVDFFLNINVASVKKYGTVVCVLRKVY